MILYYPHIFGATVYECIENSLEFETVEDMKDWLATHYEISKDDVVISEEIGYDDRIGIREEHKIFIKRYDDTDYVSMYGHPRFIGYCALRWDPEGIKRAKEKARIELMGCNDGLVGKEN